MRAVFPLPAFQLLIAAILAVLLCSRTVGATEAESSSLAFPLVVLEDGIETTDTLSETAETPNTHNHLVGDEALLSPAHKMLKQTKKKSKKSKTVDLTIFEDASDEVWRRAGYFN